ncbi:Cell division cycle protein [Dirofilaria immitis]
MNLGIDGVVVLADLHWLIKESEMRCLVDAEQWASEMLFYVSEDWHSSYAKHKLAQPEKPEMNYNTVDPHLTKVAGFGLFLLRLAIVRNLSNNMLCAIFRALPSLTSFTLIYSIDGRFICPVCIDVLTFVQLFQYCPKISELELHDCVTVDTTRLAVAAHSHFHNSNTFLGSDDDRLKIIVKTRERKRRRDSLNKLLRCCTEIENTQNTTVINIYKTCCVQKKQ